MKKLMAGLVFGACAFTTVGWGSSFDEKNLRDKGYEHAERKYLGNDEDIKRTQGDESGSRYAHDYMSHQW